MVIELVLDSSSPSFVKMERSCEGSMVEVSALRARDGLSSINTDVNKVGPPPPELPTPELPPTALTRLCIGLEVSVRADRTRWAMWYNWHTMREHCDPVECVSVDSFHKDMIGPEEEHSMSRSLSESNSCCSESCCCASSSPSCSENVTTEDA